MVRKGLGLLDLTETKRKDGRPKTTAKTERRQNIKNNLDRLDRQRIPIPRESRFREWTPIILTLPHKLVTER